MDSKLIESLKVSPFFKHMDVISIDTFPSGLSHQVFKVVCVGYGQHQGAVLTYVAKYVADKETGRQEYEGLVLAHTVDVGVNPVYCDDIWLITEYFSGDNLDKVALPIEEKLALVLPRISQYHAHSLYCTNKTNNKPLLYTGKKLLQLDLNNVISTLLSGCTLDSRTREQFKALATQNMPAEVPEYLTVIHGDLNFSNVLIKPNTNEIKLIDFESASIAPVEYDLGMMLAVNEITPNTFYNSLNHYINSHNINTELVTRYSILSCIINTLWYLEQYNHYSDTGFKQRAERQMKYLTLLTS